VRFWTDATQLDPTSKREPSANNLITRIKGGTKLRKFYSNHYMAVGKVSLEKMTYAKGD